MTQESDLQLVGRGVFTPNEAARDLHVRASEVRRMLQVGELGGWRMAGEGRHWRVSLAECDRWIEEQEARGREEIEEVRR